jgi:hypothetical protein
MSTLNPERVSVTTIYTDANKRETRGNTGRVIASCYLIKVSTFNWNNLYIDISGITFCGVTEYGRYF